MAEQEPMQLLYRIDSQGAVMAEQLRAISEHLKTLNGRVGASEQRLSALEMVHAEQRGAKNLMMLIMSIPSGIIAAAAVWIGQHLGTK